MQRQDSVPTFVVSHLLNRKRILTSSFLWDKTDISFATLSILCPCSSTQRRMVMSIRLRVCVASTLWRIFVTCICWVFCLVAQSRNLCALSACVACLRILPHQRCSGSDKSCFHWKFCRKTSLTLSWSLQMNRQPHQGSTSPLYPHPSRRRRHRRNGAQKMDRSRRAQQQQQLLLPRENWKWRRELRAGQVCLQQRETCRGPGYGRGCGRGGDIGAGAY